MPAAAPLPAPVFTECVPEGDSSGSPPRDARNMAVRLQEILEQIQSQANPTVRALLHECLQSLLAFYGEGLGRVLELTRESTGGEAVLARLCQDKSVSALLLIHGLHPLSLEERLQLALASVQPYMRSHGGDVQLLGLEQGVARLRLAGTCKSCPSSAVTLELAVRRALEEHCPDLAGFEVEDAPVASGEK